MSEFKFEPKPPPEIPEDAGWEDTLRRSLKYDIDAKHTLQGYWENACDEAVKPAAMDSSALHEHVNKVRESAVECFICNLNDMSKEDAIIALVNLYAEDKL